LVLVADARAYGAGQRYSGGVAPLRAPTVPRTNDRFRLAPWLCRGRLEPPATFAPLLEQSPLAGLPTVAATTAHPQLPSPPSRTASGRAPPQRAYAWPIALPSLPSPMGERGSAARLRSASSRQIAPRPTCIAEGDPCADTSGRSSPDHAALWRSDARG